MNIINCSPTFNRITIYFKSVILEALLQIIQSIIILFLHTDTARLENQPYDSQVWLRNTGTIPTVPLTTSNGVLQVYLNNAWGAVCRNRFTQSAADTVCVQRGFTNSLNISANTLLG